MGRKIKNEAMECCCGCGTETQGGWFAPGHDARFRSILVKAVHDGDKDAKDRLAHAPAIPEPSGDIDATYDESRTCNFDCMYALSDRCVCSCGGENHQQGWSIFSDRIEAIVKMVEPDEKSQIRQDLIQMSKATIISDILDPHGIQHDPKARKVDLIEIALADSDVWA